MQERLTSGQTDVSGRWCKETIDGVDYHVDIQRVVDVAVVNPASIDRRLCLLGITVSAIELAAAEPDKDLSYAGIDPFSLNGVEYLIDVCVHV